MAPSSSGIFCDPCVEGKDARQGPREASSEKPSLLGLAPVDPSPAPAILSGEGSFPLPGQRVEHQVPAPLSLPCCLPCKGPGCVLTA